MYTSVDHNIIDQSPNITMGIQTSTINSYHHHPIIKIHHNILLKQHCQQHTLINIITYIIINPHNFSSESIIIH